jgi:DNA invertase Pin-like site-specific DNA recombinase
MLRDAVRGKFDILAAWAVDRLGRSLQDLVATLGELRAAGIDLFLHQQAVDTTSPSGRAMFQMLGVFAEFERAMIQERVKTGLARARAAGKTLGRPRVSADEQGILEAVQSGLSIPQDSEAVRSDPGQGAAGAGSLSPIGATRLVCTWPPRGTFQAASVLREPWQA